MKELYTEYDIRQYQDWKTSKGIFIYSNKRCIYLDDVLDGSKGIFIYPLDRVFRPNMNEIIKKEWG